MKFWSIPGGCHMLRVISAGFFFLAIWSVVQRKDQLVQVVYAPFCKLTEVKKRKCIPLLMLLKFKVIPLHSADRVVHVYVGYLVCFCSNFHQSEEEKKTYITSILEISAFI